ncbi:hypothetical protein CR983_00580 [Candidatus Saccharibacteria bacterium]|nr:MAG: hypothetical protein CR983_00580 [Candidatus Saccharibacteria bacterium]
MQHTIREHIKTVLTDRPYTIMAIAVLAVAFVFSLATILAIQPRDIQVVTRYTAMGESHYYKDQWYSLYSLALFGLTVGLLHVALMVKLFVIGRRDVGMLMGGCALVVLFVAVFYVYQILGLAFP